MIRVTPQPEPDIFDSKVRQPGREFLRETPKPNTTQWKNHAYWGKVHTNLHKVYSGICAYSCHWIAYDTGSCHVEHFLPKNRYPLRAYEWLNYRLACGILNSKKGTRAILDPFTIQNGWFVLQFPSLLVKPGRELDPDLTQSIISTRDILGLNDEDTCVKSRQKYITDYCEGRISFQHLQNEAPFIAMELERQGIADLETLKVIMSIE